MMSCLVSPLARFWLGLRHRTLGRRYGRLVLEKIDGVPLVVLPDVFNPVLFRTGELLARTVITLPRFPGGNGETSVLDLGTGSGVGAVFAARRGARVVAVDVNPEAVRCARLNALLNRLENLIEVRCGDLFEPVAGEQFDWVLFNPPFFRGTPRRPMDFAWRGEDVLERFAAGLRDVLKDQGPGSKNIGGRALLVLSTDGESRAALTALHQFGFLAQPVARRDLLNEVLTVYQIEQMGRQ